MPVGCSAEAELALHLCATASRRADCTEALDALLPEVDLVRLRDFASNHRVLALVGSRLMQVAPERVPEWFRAEIHNKLEFNRHRSMLIGHLTEQACSMLESQEIAVVPLKGTLLAEHAHGDIGLREASSDIDLLVGPADMRSALRALEKLGYDAYDAIDWGGGLPHYHWRLATTEPIPLGLELHWRIHWYETRLTEQMLRRARPHARCRQLAAIDELLTLLLVFVRDGYVGLRIASDLAAWWDRNGSDLPLHALDEVLEANPALRDTLLAATSAAERTVGVPKERLVSPSWRESRRARLATRLINWPAVGSADDVTTNITLNDLLLTPPGAYRVFVRHYYMQPLEKYVAEYAWPPEQRTRNRLRRLCHAGARVLKSGWKYQRRLWDIRGGREWAPPLPTPAASPAERSQRSPA